MKMLKVKRIAALILILCMASFCVIAEEVDDSWFTFLLICNEGMQNTGANAGNTMMIVGMNSDTGKIRMALFTWDTFVDYEGYDIPQKIDMPYRNNGPEETVKVFEDNFGVGIDRFMSLNYSNLASLIDTYNGVNVDITRAERNALNSMVASKKNAIQAQAESGFVSQILIEMMAKEYYLDDFGPDTHLNGLQAVGYGWLQYDSVYNCCQREGKVVSNLFESVALDISSKTVFYTEETGKPASLNGRRAINIDNMTDEDIEFLGEQVAPIFQMSYNNLTEEDILMLTETVARNAYEAYKQGIDLFESVEFAVFPIEALKPYDNVAGTYGHLVDKEANGKAILQFLYR